LFNKDGIFLEDDKVRLKELEPQGGNFWNGRKLTRE
jgi:hypothetical protein